MNAVSRVSSLSLALPVSVVSFTSFLSHSSPFFFSLLLSFLSLFPPTSLVVDFFLTPRSSSLSSHSLPFYSALSSSNPFISRSRFRGSVPFFPFRPVCSPPSLPPARPAALQTRPRALPSTLAFPASPALRRSDRLRIHCEIDRPKRVPEWPERYEGNRRKWGM